MTQENVGADAVLGAAAGLAGGAIGAAVGLLGQATAFLDSMAGPATQKFEVDKDNILKAGKIIQDQSKALATALDDALEKLQVDVSDRSGAVSADIAGAWNSRLLGGNDTYAGRVQKYVESLDGLGAQLRESAEQYGFTDEEITATFGPKA